MINPELVVSARPCHSVWSKWKLTINWPGCLIKTPAIILYDNFYDGWWELAVHNTPGCTSDAGVAGSGGAWDAPRPLRSWSLYSDSNRRRRNVVARVGRHLNFSTVKIRYIWRWLYVTLGFKKRVGLSPYKSFQPPSLSCTHWPGCKIVSSKSESSLPIDSLSGHRQGQAGAGRGTVLSLDHNCSKYGRPSPPHKPSVLPLSYDSKTGLRSEVEFYWRRHCQTQFWRRATNECFIFLVTDYEKAINSRHSLIVF